LWNIKLFGSNLEDLESTANRLTKVMGTVQGVGDPSDHKGSISGCNSSPRPLHRLLNTGTSAAMYFKRYLRPDIRERNRTEWQYSSDQPARQPGSNRKMETSCCQRIAPLVFQ